MQEDDVKAEGYEFDTDLVETQEQKEVEQPEASPESSEEASEQPKQDWKDKRLATQTHKLRRAEEKIKELEEVANRYKPKDDAVPEVPEFPDADLRYENPDEYSRRVRERDAAIEARAKALARNEAARASEESRRQQEVRQQQEEAAKLLASFETRGIESGLSREKMVHNERVLLEAEVGRDLGMYLYEDQHGPRIMDYLAANPEELDTIVSMPVYRAVDYIAQNIKPKVAQVKPKSSKAPDPVKPAKGAGIAEKDPFDVLPAGYSIE